MATTSETNAAQRLKDSGLRLTRAREAVLRILEKAGHPLSHQELRQKLKAGTFDRVTVYRTLETLQATGLLHRIQGNDGVWRFCGHGTQAPSACPGNHIHFLCSRCGRMSCLPEQPLPWVTPPKGARILSKQLVVHGLCSACAAQADADD
ncbi:MAG TPA: transcriptional repressor [Elusimicrobia bacterium]|nr:transcriptional repressor [Elusimicrobiota bacterium]